MNRWKGLYFPMKMATNLRQKVSLIFDDFFERFFWFLAKSLNSRPWNGAIAWWWSLQQNVAKELSTRCPRKGAGGVVCLILLGRQTLTTIRHDTEKRIFLTIYEKCKFSLAYGFRNQQGLGPMIAIAKKMFGLNFLCPQTQGQSTLAN